MKSLQPGSRFFFVASLLFAQVLWPANPASQKWPYYGGDQGGSKYSILDEINKGNVAKLTQAWEWRTGEKALPQYRTFPGMFEVTPVMVDGTLYLSTPYNRVVALEADSGREKWSFDPKGYEDGQVPNGTGFVHRGVALWRDPASGKRRVFINSRARLIALDTETGQPENGFGDNGSVNLVASLRW